VIGLCIISLQNYFCVKFLKINYLNLVPAPIFWVPAPIFFTKKHWFQHSFISREKHFECRMTTAREAACEVPDIIIGRPLCMTQEVKERCAITSSFHQLQSNAIQLSSFTTLLSFETWQGLAKRKISLFTASFGVSVSFNSLHVYFQALWIFTEYTYTLPIRPKPCSSRFF